MHLIDSKRGNLLPPLHGLLFPICHPTERTSHTMACVTPVVECWLEREIVEKVFLVKAIKMKST